MKRIEEFLIFHGYDVEFACIECGSFQSKQSAPAFTKITPHGMVGEPLDRTLWW